MENILVCGILCDVKLKSVLQLRTLYHTSSMVSYCCLEKKKCSRLRLGIFSFTPQHYDTIAPSADGNTW